MICARDALGRFTKYDFPAMSQDRFQALELKQDSDRGAKAKRPGSARSECGSPQAAGSRTPRAITTQTLCVAVLERATTPEIVILYGALAGTSRDSNR
eukprot:gene9273-889_t